VFATVGLRVVCTLRSRGGGQSGPVVSNRQVCRRSAPFKEEPTPTAPAPGRGLPGVPPPLTAGASDGGSRREGKETRAALIAQVGTGTYVHQTARFAPTAAELASGAGRPCPAAGYGGEPNASEDGGGELDGCEAAPEDDDCAEQDGTDETAPSGFGDPVFCQSAA